ncbi:hypothetical protein [Actinophytocola sp.]|uniref:hypothetical protein n=1 Tax=Actinophytocola sp. TaxID=1872138 RepID=UPI003D6B1527
MHVTPEILRAEMDYRVERARGGTAPEYVSEVRRTHRAWFRHPRDHTSDDHGEHRSERRRTTVNGAPRAA